MLRTNRCAQQRFFVRWRSLGDAVEVQSTAYDSGGTIRGWQDHADGRAGWMSMNGCEQPAFRFGTAKGSNGSTLTDVAVTVQRWEASA